MNARMSFFSVVLLAGHMAVAASGTVTFEDLSGSANNDPLPSSDYSTGLPGGVTATWTGWLLHTTSYLTPMSVFPAGDQAGDDAVIEFSESVVVSSLGVMGTTHGSAFSLTGYLGNAQVWQYDAPADSTWYKVTAGAGLEIDRIVAEGQWNHIDDITVAIPGAVELTPLSLHGVHSSSNAVDVRWMGTPGETHQLQYSDSLMDPQWLNVGDDCFGLGDTNNVWAAMGNDNSRFYRVEVTDVLPTDEVRAEVDVVKNGLPAPPAGFKWQAIPEYTDEFNGSSLDTSKWQPEHPYWSGRDPSEHLPANVSVADGKLRLKNSVITDPSNVADPNYDVWVGAACVTSIDQTASYGYYEAKVKASSVCMTSAFWFQSKGSPTIEIDVVEQMGVSYSNSSLENQMLMNTHYVLNNDWSNDIFKSEHWTMPSKARDEYHVYGVWWKDKDTVWMYHNRQHVATMTLGGDFNRDQYMFFDTEVFRWQGLPTVENLNDDSRNTMYVDWVRGWELVPE